MRQLNNLKAWREQSGLTLEQLAEKLSVTGATISRIENGSQQPRPQLLKAIVEYFRVEAGDFYSMTSNLVPASIGSHRVPLLTQEQAITWLDNDSPHKEEQMQAFVVTDVLYSAQVFALKIQGKAMLPAFDEGDVILVDPAVLPTPDDFVLACLDNKETVFRRYKDKGLNDEGQHVFELVPFNDSYPVMRSDRHLLRIIGTVVENRRYYQKHKFYV